jgi:hypothetical protein
MSMKSESKLNTTLSGVLISDSLRKPYHLKLMKTAALLYRAVMKDIVLSKVCVTCSPE